MIRQLTALTLVAALFAGGCNMATVERPIVDYYGTGNVPLIAAPFKGEYVLQQIPKQGGYVLIWRGPINPPAKVGFEKSADGTVNAIAGDKDLPLEPGFYSWRGTPAEGQYDSSRTAQGVVTTVLVIAGVALVVGGIAALF